MSPILLQHLGHTRKKRPGQSKVTRERRKGDLRRAKWWGGASAGDSVRLLVA